nr:type IV pilus modification protein PilV [Pseudomonas luteola]
MKQGCLISTNKEKGLSLIEVLVTLLIFTIGLLGLATLQLNALKSTADSNQRSQATWILQDLAERMRANDSFTSNASETVSAYTEAPNCAILPSPICADHYDPISGKKINASSCDAIQMAKFDRWEAQCSYAASSAYSENSVAASARYNSRDFISAPSSGNPITVTELKAGLYKLNASWKGKGDDSTNRSAGSEKLSAEVTVTP